MSDIRSIEQIDEALQECIDHLSRKRNLKNEYEILKDISFVQERFENIKPNLVGVWSSIVIVNRVHNVPDEYIKELMVLAYRSSKHIESDT